MGRGNWLKGIRALLLALMAFALTSCANVEYRDPADPLEPFNRAMYEFNDSLDKVLISPLARGYSAIVPAPVSKGISNFFSNLDDVSSAINNLLQLKLERAVSDVGRVVVNSTVGLLGFVDIASNLDMPKYGEDFGQTLGSWGIDSGAYLVLPFFGPSSVRDGIGVVVDWYTDPILYVEDDTLRYSLRGLRLIDRREALLSTSNLLEQAALDPYSFVRDAYLQKRLHDVYDGNPPAELDGGF